MEIESGAWIGILFIVGIIGFIIYYYLSKNKKMRPLYQTIADRLGLECLTLDNFGKTMVKGRYNGFDVEMFNDKGGYGRFPSFTISVFLHTPLQKNFKVVNKGFRRMFKESANPEMHHDATNFEIKGSAKEGIAEAIRSDENIKKLITELFAPTEKNTYLEITVDERSIQYSQKRYNFFDKPDFIKATLEDIIEKASILEKSTTLRY